jgi:hypothetical protein
MGDAGEQRADLSAQHIRVLHGSPALFVRPQVFNNDVLS